MTEKRSYRRLMRLAFIIVIIICGSVDPLSSTDVPDNASLTELITSIEDPLINVYDLAFLLVTHDFDATPKKDFVEVVINGTTYILVPNGQYRGVANVSIKS